ncbi:polyprenyl synthetase family protein [Scytonema sp. PCC 10023]|uniref:polyprenyl synthetase family protein n=1 Tax=Scytonema sp. PCC 10023 TaxID=1680591 RepID=UPI0039C6BBEB
MLDLDSMKSCRERVNFLLTNYYDQENPLYQPLNLALFYSRRRLRATLAYWGSGIVGGIPEDADNIAMLYEIITANYVLIDDSVILDAGKERAGLPTPRIQYGEAAALLSACIIQLEPIRLLPSDNLLLKEIFYQSARDTIIGLFLEQKLADLSPDSIVDEKEILRIARLMTGPLLAGAITSGAIMSGATQAQIDALNAYAMDFGTAYQIADHIVDLMVTAENSGKDNFSDITTNKKTIVVNHALQHLPKDSWQWSEIINAIGTVPSAEKKSELQRIFKNSGSIQHCLNLVVALYSQAISHLQELPDNQYRSLCMKLPDIYLKELLNSIDG